MPDEILAGALAPLFSRVRTSTCCVKRATGVRRVNQPLTHEKLAHHVNGGPACGVYPMEPGASTTLLALFDLDSHCGETAWPDMQRAGLAVMTALASASVSRPAVVKAQDCCTLGASCCTLGGSCCR